MTKNLISTEDLFMGYNREEECFINDNVHELFDNKNVDDETICFDDELFNECISEFKKYLEFYMAKFERDSGDEVIEILMLGDVGLWNGKFIGGRILDLNKDNPFYMDVDDLYIRVNDKNIIEIKGVHHDGTHYFYLYPITENMLSKIHLLEKYEVYGNESFSCKELELIASMSKRIELVENNIY